MAETSQENSSTPPGFYARPAASSVSVPEIGGMAAALLWLIGTTLFLVFGGTNEGLGNLLTLVVVVLPLAMIWVVTMTARATRLMREENARLQGSIDAVRQALIADAQGRGSTVEPTIVRKLEEIAQATRKTETAIASFHSMRSETPVQSMAQPGATAEPLADEQSVLALGTRLEDATPALPVAEVVRALNFPETAEDEAGFASLRRAMQDRGTAQLITAAQDILTLLSQDGIYMDDLQPDHARPEAWRKFAAGERGRAIAALGGVRDRSSLALTAGRMKQDPIFRDAAHHFLRRFDQHFSEFAETAADEDIVHFANTRTARAFMLLGRVAGTFD